MSTDRGQVAAADDWDDEMLIYRPDSERSSHYFEAVLAEQFDAMIWMEQTQPVTALPLPKSQHLDPEDETFPFGV